MTILFLGHQFFVCGKINLNYNKKFSETFSKETDKKEFQLKKYMQENKLV